MARPKKTAVRARPKTGLAAAPLNNFDNLKHYFHYEMDNKKLAEIVKTWVRQTFNKDESKAILANPEYNFHLYSHYAAYIHWNNNNCGELPEKWAKLPERTVEFYRELIAKGKAILAEKTEIAQVKKVVRLTPQQLMARKINDTIMVDIDELEDSWIEGEKAEALDLYELFKKHELKGNAVETVRRRLEGWLLDYTDAYDKNCEQAVEGYSHLTRRELKRRIKVVETMIADLDKVKVAAKATRTVRVKKPKAADKQVARLKYKKEDIDLKLVSVNPVTLIGAMRAVVVNAKYKTVTEYISNRANGFEVKGTSLVGFDVETSRTKVMRKPEEFIKFLTKTPNQFKKAFDALSTKERAPNGRFNDETLIIKVQ
jgi:hypothetical protein